MEIKQYRPVGNKPNLSDSIQEYEHNMMMTKEIKDFVTDNIVSTGHDLSLSSQLLQNCSLQEIVQQMYLQLQIQDHQLQQQKQINNLLHKTLHDSGGFTKALIRQAEDHLFKIHSDAKIIEFYYTLSNSLSRYVNVLSAISTGIVKLSTHIEDLTLDTMPIKIGNYSTLAVTMATKYIPVVGDAASVGRKEYIEKINQTIAEKILYVIDTLSPGGIDHNTYLECSISRLALKITNLVAPILEKNDNVIDIIITDNTLATKVGGIVLTVKDYIKHLFSKHKEDIAHVKYQINKILKIDNLIFSEEEKSGHKFAQKIMQALYSCYQECDKVFHSLSKQAQEETSLKTLINSYGIENSIMKLFGIDPEIKQAYLSEIRYNDYDNNDQILFSDLLGSVGHEI